MDLFSHHPRKSSIPWLPIAVFTFFGLFLVFPLIQLLKGGFYYQGKWTLDFFQLLIHNPFYQQCLLNSLFLGAITTLIALAVSFPLAWIFERYSFAGKKFFYAIALIPLIYPPFVTAQAIKQIFARYGTLNLILQEKGWVSPQNPIDFLGGASFTGVILISVLHAIPIMLLALRSTLSRIDPTLLQASLNLGANRWTHSRRILLPLAFPGIFAGCTLVFIGAFTDLGAPLMFEVQETIPTQIFNQVTQPDQPLGYLLVTLTLGIVILLFSCAQKFLPGSQTDFSIIKTSFQEIPRKFPRIISPFVMLFLFFLTSLVLLPLIGTAIISFSKMWFMTPFPTEWSTLYWKEAVEDPLIRSSFQNSLFYSFGACLLNLILGLMIAFSLARLTFPGKGLLRVLVLIPMALPGLVIAFAYWVSLSDAPHPALQGFWKKWIDPREAPVVLLILSYAMHRITFVVQLLMAGYAQISLTLEHAAQNLGASFWSTFRRITLPLLTKSLSGGLLIVFAFSMLEVSSGMILAQESPFYPISKAIYSVLGRVPPEAASMASALGILCVVGVGLILWIANRKVKSP